MNIQLSQYYHLFYKQQYARNDTEKNNQSHIKQDLHNSATYLHS